MKEWNRRLLCWALVVLLAFCCVWALVRPVEVALAGTVIGPLTPFVAAVVGWYFKLKKDERIATGDRA